jgi:hypothetical protein
VPRKFTNGARSGPPPGPRSDTGGDPWTHAPLQTTKYVARYSIVGGFVLPGFRVFFDGAIVRLDIDPELADFAREHPERFQLINPKPD